ncbi:DMT family transporter [Oceanivirga salmonicida]|uniref:DMT family transporter n=1 Tax=Oceanivirga salmonicida TaxID=1769291 RepID=UPI0008301ED6|nr:DMT family transporter [Oceanivirga salmonicida]
MKKNCSTATLGYGWILISFAAFLWGLDGVLLTPRYFALGFYNVKFIVFISHLVPLVVLSILFTGQYKKIKEFKKDDFIYYFLIALFGGTLGTLAIVKALMLSQFSLSLVTLIQKTQPIFAIILAYTLLKEKPNKRFYIVLAVSLISLYFLIFGLNSPKLLEENNLRAAMYSLIAAFSFGSSTVFSKKIVSNHSFLTTVFYRYLFTTIISFSILIFSSGSIVSLRQYISSPDLYKLTFIIALFSLTSLTVYYKGMITTKASYATISELAYPLSSVIIEALVYKRILSPIQLIFSAILIISIIYLNKNNNK